MGSWGSESQELAVDHDCESVGEFNRAAIRHPADREKDCALAVRRDDTRGIARRLAIDAIPCVQ